ncbi:MAG: chorismate-binding protein, partial [Bacteriovoracaceae bacterium]|nr:chorismate-binding protein [Bacteriovoracaceae bacterium]
VHQFSIVEANAHEGLNLYQLVKGLFPGGSVTGAPKKNVLKILRKLEAYDRGMYCGSTIVLHKNLKAGSINIRSCEIDFTTSELKYCAGGGITLKSRPQDEFDETYAKMESFLQLLKL